MLSRPLLWVRAVWWLHLWILVAWLTWQAGCAGTSDLAGQIVGALVSTALVFREKEPTYYNKLMTEARDLYSAAVARKKAYSSPFIYDCAPPVRPLEGRQCASLVLASGSMTQGQACLGRADSSTCTNYKLLVLSTVL